MAEDTLLYHWRHAPQGRRFDVTSVSLDALAKEGWVDDPAKIGVNPWGRGHANAVAARHNSYRRGEIPAIDQLDLTEKKCAIWGTLTDDKPLDAGWNKAFDSPRAGGLYLVSPPATILLEQQDDLLKARLTSWLIEQRRLGAECPEITPATIKDAARLRGLPVHERADRLLQYIASQTQHVASRIAFVDPNVCTPALAWSESIGMDEVEYLLAYLEKQGWLESSGDTRATFLLTVEGHTRIAALKTSQKESSQGFVAMWFDDSTDSAWSEGIKPGIEDAGYEAFRIDRKEHSNKIDDEIIAELRRSRFVVADFTQGDDGARGGVYYEAGFAHGLNIPVIFACRKDTLKKLHLTLGSTIILFGKHMKNCDNGLGRAFLPSWGTGLARKAKVRLRAKLARSTGSQQMMVVLPTWLPTAPPILSSESDAEYRA